LLLRKHADLSVVIPVSFRWCHDEAGSQDILALWPDLMAQHSGRNS
jgi:hypothetical protein